MKVNYQNAENIIYIASQGENTSLPPVVFHNDAITQVEILNGEVTISSTFQLILFESIFQSGYYQHRIQTKLSYVIKLMTCSSKMINIIKP